MARTIDTFTELQGHMFDIRDVIARFEQLESERENSATGDDDAQDARLLAEFDESPEGEEYAAIRSFLDHVRGYGGDEQWRGRLVSRRLHP